jgi:hypothetical protein
MSMSTAILNSKERMITKCCIFCRSQPALPTTTHRLITMNAARKRQLVTAMQDFSNNPKCSNLWCGLTSNGSLGPLCNCTSCKRTEVYHDRCKPFGWSRDGDSVVGLTCTDCHMTVKAPKEHKPSVSNTAEPSLPSLVTQATVLDVDPASNPKSPSLPTAYTQPQPQRVVQPVVQPMRKCESVLGEPKVRRSVRTPAPRILLESEPVPVSRIPRQARSQPSRPARVFRGTNVT